MRTFKQWYDENLSDYTEDINGHGCDAGFPCITYTSDCVELYNEFESEIYQALNEDAESLGYDSPDAMIAEFNRKDMLQDPDQRKNLLLWYMVEKTAREIEACRESEECSPSA